MFFVSLFPCYSLYLLRPGDLAVLIPLSQGPALGFVFILFCKHCLPEMGQRPEQEPLTAAVSSLQLVHTFLSGVGEAGLGCGPERRWCSPAPTSPGTLGCEEKTKVYCRTLACPGAACSL